MNAFRQTVYLVALQVGTAHHYYVGGLSQGIPTFHENECVPYSRPGAAAEIRASILRTGLFKPEAVTVYERTFTKSTGEYAYRAIDSAEPNKIETTPYHNHG